MIGLRPGTQCLKVLQQSGSIFLLRPTTVQSALHRHALPWRVFSSTVKVQPPRPSDPASSASNPTLVPNTYFPLPTQPPQRPRRRRRYIRSAIYAVVFFTFGYYSCRQVISVFFPSHLPLPGTLEDGTMKARIAFQGNTLTMTKTLDADPAWVYLTSGTDPPVFARGFMAGARAIAYQVVFRNHADQVEVSILYIGQGLSGFPNTTHGGAIATVMDEVCRRTAINSARSIKPAEFKCELEALDMTYKAPANTGQFYTLVSNVDGDASTDGLYTIRATLKTRRGKPCAEATARYRMTELENGRSIAKGDVKTLEKGGEGDEGNNMIDASRCQKETVYKS